MPAPLICAELFALRGDEWNRPNYQSPASPVVRTIEGPDGRVRREIEWEIDGYGPCDPGGPRAAIHKRAPYEPARANPRPKIHMEARPWKPEYRPVGKVHVVVAPNAEKPLTEEQLKMQRHQRAAVKARQTRARNQLVAQEQDRLQALKELLKQIGG